jgi:hypothetical protein
LKPYSTIHSLAIPLDRETDLIYVVSSSGCEEHRDDTLIASIGAEM